MEEDITITWIGAAYIAGIATAAIVISLIALWLARTILRQVTKRTATQIDDVLVTYALRPGWLVFPAIALYLALAFVQLPAAVLAGARHVISLVLIAGVAWLLISLCNAVIEIVTLRFRMDVEDNLEARRIHTQVRVLMRTLAVLIIIVAAAVMLMTFPRVRELGISILASAGLAGIVVGFAARPVLENLIAGVQIALTQPIRLDDVVIIEGEFGRIEEIRNTYVVVRVWDQRRLIVPLNWFVQNIFQNWTRTTADITGTVYLYLDYRTPVEVVRRKLHELLESSEKWDHKAWGLQVTDTTEKTITLRAVMTASSAGNAWDLRCFVREMLVDFLQKEYPESLPRMREEIDDQRPPREDADATA
jgi:small-conductance mechanosensitive channel